MGQTFKLVSRWSIPAPVESVWDQLRHTQDWPRWWPYVQEVSELRAGGRDGVGGVQRFVWRSRLPYRIVLVTRVTRIDRLRFIEAEVMGDLRGTGRWYLRPFQGTTLVRYEWRVRLHKPWMQRLAPCLRPVYVWNHNAVMRAGEAGLTARLAGDSRVREVRAARR